MWLETVKSESLPVALSPLVVPILGFFFSDVFNPIAIILQAVISYIGMAVVGVPIVGYLVKKDKLSNLFIGFYGMLGGAIFGLVVGLVMLFTSVGDIRAFQTFSAGLITLLSLGYGAVTGFVVGATFGVIRHIRNEA
jgi:hypothetical protein